MTILLVRHGETEWNRARRYQGWSDSALTARGIAQAEAIGHRLRALPEAAAAGIVASPIGRARRTAEIIAECLGRTAPLRFYERLREISLGARVPPLAHRRCAIRQARAGARREGHRRGEGWGEGQAPADRQY